MRDRLLVTGQMVLLTLLVVLPWLSDAGGFDVPWLRTLGYALVVAGGLVVLTGALHLGDALTALPTPRHGAGLRSSSCRWRHRRRGRWA